MSLASAESVTKTHTPIAFDGPVRTAAGTLSSGQNLTAGSVLGRVTASGELIESVATANDGSEQPVGILVHAVDASGGALGCQMYVSGDLNADLITWDASFTAALQAGAFDGTPINLVNPS